MAVTPAGVHALGGGGVGGVVLAGAGGGVGVSGSGFWGGCVGGCSRAMIFYKKNILLECRKVLIFFILFEEDRYLKKRGRA
ncbi:hypothetical protein CCP2SC5_660001 [Azospirillaceae bacterium]